MCTIWSVLKAFTRYDGSKTAHEDVVAVLKSHGRNVKMSDAWCTETVMSVFYDADAIDLIGGYAADSGSLKEHAKKKGIWHSGSSGILPGDIVLYGKNGKTNHTEFAIGENLNISGNYNGGCYRRKRSGRTIIGYVRPKYKTMPEMNNLQICIAACDCILGVYGSGKNRITNLFVFGSTNAEKIRTEINRIWDSIEKTVFDLAVYTIAGFAGKDPYRTKRLGNWAESVQAKINTIASYGGKSDDYAANYVLSDLFGTNAIRKLLLEFCGYNPSSVQKIVNSLLTRKSESDVTVREIASIVSLFRDAPRTNKDTDGLQGDCVIIKSGDEALIMDVYRSGALDRIVSEISDSKTVSLYFSHPHSDHMGSNANTLIRTGKISKCFLPPKKTISTDYRSRYDKLVTDCSKYGVETIEITKGSTFDCGAIHGEVLHHQYKSKDSVNMRSLCTVITVAGIVYLTCGDHHCGTSDSDFHPSIQPHIYKASHHGMFTGDKEKFLNAIKPQWIFYNWKEWPRNGLGQDPKVRAAVNAYQKYGNLLSGDLNGRIEFKIEDGMITVIGEKGMIGRTITYIGKDGKSYRKTVHVCEKAKFHEVQSMIPRGEQIHGVKNY